MPQDPDAVLPPAPEAGWRAWLVTARAMARVGLAEDAARRLREVCEESRDAGHDEVFLEAFGALCEFAGAPVVLFRHAATLHARAARWDKVRELLEPVLRITPDDAESLKLWGIAADSLGLPSDPPDVDPPRRLRAPRRRILRG